MIKTKIIESLPLNKGKLEDIQKTVKEFAKEKDKFLIMFSNIKYLHLLNKRTIRDNLIKQKYKSKLRSHLWQNALKEALMTIDKYWQSSLIKTRQYVYRNFNENERKKMFLILKSYPKIQNIMKGNVKGIDEKLRRNIRKNLGKRPRVKLCRSIVLDSSLYRVNEKYIFIPKFSKKGKTIIIPLKQDTKDISGNICIVVIDNYIQVHYYKNIIPLDKKNVSEISIDKGITELFVDSDGDSYYTDFGKDIQKYSNYITNKSEKRRKLYLISKNKNNRNIIKNNLGKKKMNKYNKKYQGKIKTKICTAINQLMKKNPSIVGGEDLSKYNVSSNTKFSRITSMWPRKILEHFLPFKLMVGSSNYVVLNPAYSSQMCHRCGYVDAKNRNGDIFKCLKCGMILNADFNAAINLKSRLHDKEINIYMKPSQVKIILTRRYQFRAGL